MARLIDADKLKNHYAWWQGGTLEKTLDEMKRDFDTIVDLQPTVEAEPIKHGTWGENIYGYRKCSVCGRVTQVDECMREPLYLYCPYCGAKMDEVEE